MKIGSRAGLMLAALLASSLAVAAPITFHASLSGLAESPPVASPGTGFATVVFDDVANTMEIDVTFSGLIGNTTAAHIHCCTAAPLSGTAGVATTTPSFVGFPLGVTAGSFHNILDLTLPSSFRAAFITANGGTVAGAEAALLAGLLDGTAYFNIHTSFAPGGEIRGFLRVPEPQSLALAALALIALAWTQRRRRLS